MVMRGWMIRGWGCMIGMNWFWVMKGMRVWLCFGVRIWKGCVGGGNNKGGRFVW